MNLLLKHQIANRNMISNLMLKWIRDSVVSAHEHFSHLFDSFVEVSIYEQTSIVQKNIMIFQLKQPDVVQQSKGISCFRKKLIIRKMLLYRSLFITIFSNNVRSHVNNPLTTRIDGTQND